MTSINNTTPSNYVPYDLTPTQDSIAGQFGGDTAAELAAMVFLFSRERSKDAADTRDALENGIQARQAEQVHQMHKQADANFTSAIVKGIGQVVDGVVSLDSNATGEDKGAAKIFGATCNVTGAVFDKVASEAEAEATAQGHKADAGIRALEQVDQDSADAREMRNRTLDFMSSIQDIQAETDKALVSIRV